MSSPSNFPLHNSYTFWISRLAATMQEAFNARLKEYDVTWPQWMVLNVLSEKQATTPATVAAAIGVDRSAVTRLLDRLEKKHLVLRQHDKLDRRSISLGITAKGLELMARLDQAAAEHQQQFLSKLHSTEHRSFRGNLQKLLKSGGVDASHWR